MDILISILIFVVVMFLMSKLGIGCCGGHGSHGGQHGHGGSGGSWGGNWDDGKKNLDSDNKTQR